MYKLNYRDISEQKFESSYQVKDALHLKPTQTEILASQYLNVNFFGGLSILPCGDVYSCMQLNAIGNIHQNTLKELLYTEFLTCKNWFIIRKNVSPCNSCIYNWICPSITNYELALRNVFM